MSSRLSDVDRQTSMLRGFTLIEILLVLAIIGVMITVMLPQVLGTMRQQRMRGATRTVISAGRHAMSLAVVAQREIELSFNLDSDMLTIRPAGRSGPETNVADVVDEDLDALSPAATWGDHGDVEGPEGEADAVVGGKTAILDEVVEQSLDGISIAFIEVEYGSGSQRAEQGSHAVVYYTSGRCTPYTIGLQDEDGDVVVIEVDALSSAEVVSP